MGKHAALFVIAFFCSASIASAAPITYDVTVDTRSISGTMGSFDFQFNPGPLVTQAADLQILNFTSDGTLAGSPVLTGDVAGNLSAISPTLTFDNGTGFNDYFEGFTFDTTLSFQVSLFGPALSAPDGVSTSGSRFAFSMFSDAAGTRPVLTTNPGGTNPGGFAFTIDVELDGTTTVTNFSPQTTVVPAVPEPGTLPLMAAAIGLWIAFRSRCNDGDPTLTRVRMLAGCISQGLFAGRAPDEDARWRPLCGRRKTCWLLASRRL